ncbi:MAG: hypothetical protein AAFS00_17455, partial [Bacteroidota bacterium]
QRRGNSWGHSRLCREPCRCWLYESIAVRVEEYNTKTLPVADYYRGQNKLHEVKGVGAIEEVAGRISDVLSSYA